jgi:hypothetical protein
MSKPPSPPKVLFDELFDQLLGWVVKREDLKKTKRWSVDLVDANDRLHSLRSELAVARYALTGETGIEVCSRQSPTGAGPANSQSHSMHLSPTIQTWF